MQRLSFPAETMFHNMIIGNRKVQLFNDSHILENHKTAIFLPLPPFRPFSPLLRSVFTLLLRPSSVGSSLSFIGFDLKMRLLPFIESA